MARKNRRAARAGKRVPRKISGKDAGRGSSRMSGRKPRAAVKGGPRAAPATGAGNGTGEVRRALDALNWSHAFMDKLIAGIPADKLTWQASPADNHVLWTLGHLAASYPWFSAMIDGKKYELPPEFVAAFDHKSKPVNEPLRYPSLDTVRRHYDASYQRLAEAVASMSEADAQAPTVTDSGGFARTRLEVVWRAIWHDGWHQGQISTLRRAMGLPGIM